MAQTVVEFGSEINHPYLMTGHMTAGIGYAVGYRTTGRRVLAIVATPGIRHGEVPLVASHLFAALSFGSGVMWRSATAIQVGR